MAVPASGQISLRAIRNELSANNYNGTSQFTNVSLNSMSTGANGTINTSNASTNRPNGAAPHNMSEFYSYDHDFSSTTYTRVTMYYSEDSAYGACNSEETVDIYYDSDDELSSGTDVYSTSDGSEPAADGYYKYFEQTTGFSVEDEQIGEAFSCGRSERRLKYNIEFIGDSPMGIPMYHFNYKDESHGKGRFVGTMVDDLERLGKTNCLYMGCDGSVFVDYSMIDVPFHNVII